MVILNDYITKLGFLISANVRHPFFIIPQKQFSIWQHRWQPEDTKFGLKGKFTSSWLIDTKVLHLHYYRFEQPCLTALLQVKRKIHTWAIWVELNLEIKLLLASLLYSVINRTKPLTTPSSCCAHLMSTVCELSHAISVGLELLANKQIKMRNVCVAWHKASFKPGQNYESESVSINNFSNKHADETSYQGTQDSPTPTPFNRVLVGASVWCCTFISSDVQWWN